jgi:concanavalin A-like lectin/glucanase superfamily protein
MTLPIDCIVAVYYSGSVNPASTNSQSLSPNYIPALLINQGQPLKNRDKRIWQHFDNIFRLPGLTDIISIYDKLVIHKQKSPVALLETVAISESKLRSVIRTIGETIKSHTKVAIGKNQPTTGLGTGNYVQLNSIIPFVSSISISAWVKFINADDLGYGGIVGLINGNFNNRFLLNEDAQTILFQLDTISQGPQSCSYTLPTSVFSNQWHHFAATWDGANMQLYFDGVAVGSPAPLAGVLLSGNVNTSIGMGAQNQFFLHGNMSEVALYNAGLTATQISNIYNNGANTVTTGQVAYYKMNEGSGTTVKNSAGSVDGTLENGPLWSSDIRSNITNRSIYGGFISDLVSRIRDTVRSITESAISIVGTVARLPKPFLRESTLVHDLVSRLFGPFTIREATNITEGTGFTGGFSGGFTDTPGVLRKPIPHIAAETITISDAITAVGKAIQRFITETISISESRLRRAIPKITTDVESISESIKRKLTRPISTQTTSILDTLLRVVKPKFIPESISISESQRRRAKSNIPTENTSISELSIFRAITRPISQSTVISESLPKLAKHFRTLTETSISIVETQLRKAIPKLSTQSQVSITDSVFKKPIRNISTEIVSISESKLRKVTRFVTAEINSITDSVVRTAKHFINVATQVISVVETQLRKPIPKITAQSSSINDSISFIKGRFISLLETISISESISRLAKHFRTLTETSAIVETSIKKVFKFASDAIIIAESKLRRFSPRLQDQLIVPISESIKKRTTPFISQTTSISELISAHRLFVKPLAEAGISIAQALKRTVIRPQSDTTSVSESIPRKITRLIATQSTTVSETASKLRIVPRTLIESISVTENTIKRFIKRLLSTQSTTVSESQIRKPIPKISTESTTISDSIKKKATKFMTDFISILETELRKPIPRIAAQSTTISDSQRRRVIPFISETIAVIGTQLRKLIPKITSETISISDTRLRKFIPHLSQVVSISESQLRRIILSPAGFVNISEAIQTGHKFLQKFLTETISLSDKLTRIPVPRISAQSISISDSMTKLRTVSRTISQTISISELLHAAHQVTRIITESLISITELSLRRVRPHISTDSTPIVESFFYNATHVLGLVFSVAISELIVVAERFATATGGPSFRWRFSPFRKSSFSNDFTPKRKGR